MLGATIVSLIALGICPVFPPTCPWLGASSSDVVGLSEVDLLRRSETILLGEVASVRTQKRPEGVSYVAVTIRVEDCLVGECECDSVTTYMMADAWSGRPADEFPFPEAGHRYIFCLRWLSTEPGLVWGGYRSERYEVRDNRVLGVGMTVEKTLDAIRALRATRGPEVLMDSCDLVVAGDVRGCVYAYPYPPEFGNELAHADQQRMRDGYINPDACNFVEITVDRVLKGPCAAGGVVKVVLPYRVGSGGDVPRFTKGQRVVVFACWADQGYWKICAGVDSRLIVRGNGSVGCYASVEDLAARAPN